MERSIPKSPRAIRAGSVASVLLVTGILALAAGLAGGTPCAWTPTLEQTQSLSPASLALLKEVTQPLTLTVFMPEAAGERQAAKEVLKLYGYHNSKLTYRFVDPEREPLKAQQAGTGLPATSCWTTRAGTRWPTRPTKTPSLMPCARS